LKGTASAAPKRVVENWGFGVCATTTFWDFTGGAEQPVISREAAQE